ncbi:MAG: glycosyltransferase family 25 protein [Pseudomonadota bacterium]
MEVRGFVIHLARAAERARQVARIIETAPVPTRVLDAVDAATADLSPYTPDAPLVPRYPFPLSETEIAVFLSHRSAWQAILDEGLDAALIIEDDVAFDPAAFNPAFTAALPFAQNGAYVRLPQKKRESTGEALAPLIRRPTEVALGMQAQLVGAEAARNLLAATETFDRPVDVLIQMTWIHRADILSAWPSGVSDISATLGGSTLKKRRGLGARLSAEAQRALFRWRISRVARDHAGKPR